MSVESSKLPDQTIVRVILGGFTMMSSIYLYLVFILPMFYYLQGAMQSTNRQEEAAIKSYTKVIHMNSTLQGIYLSRAFSRYFDNDMEGALEDINQHLRFSSRSSDRNSQSDASAYLLRGNIRLDGDDFEGAISDYDRALQLKPSDPYYLFRRGVARLYLGEYGRAQADFLNASNYYRQQGDYDNFSRAIRFASEAERQRNGIPT